MEVSPERILKPPELHKPLRQLFIQRKEGDAGLTGYAVSMEAEELPAQYLYNLGEVLMYIYGNPLHITKFGL